MHRLARLFLLLPLLTALSAGAQTAAPTAAPTSTAASPAKKDLVAKVLQLQQPGIETMARSLIEQPVLQLMQQVNLAISQRVPQDKREALGKEIQADVRKFIDETVPTVRDRAVKLAPSTVGTILEEKFTEDELRQVIAILESPVNRKLQSVSGEMQRALGEKLVGETRSLVQQKAQALQQSVQQRLAPYVKADAPATGK